MLAASLGVKPAPGEESDRKPMSELDRIYRILNEGDSFQVIAEIEQQPAKEAASTYHTLLKQIYSQKRDVARMGLIGRAGIHFCLSEAKKQKDADPKLADELKGLAKSMAYDLAANAWPGWQDEGVVITDTDLAHGLDAARLNLRLARELGRNADILGNAHWLLGAQLLAGGKRPEARAAFQTAAGEFQKAEKTDYEAMARGYALIAQLKNDPADEMARRELANRVQTLRTLGTPDAKFFADQLEKVSAYFLGAADSKARKNAGLHPS